MSAYVAFAWFCWTGGVWLTRISTAHVSMVMDPPEERAIKFSASKLKPHLGRCGYDTSRLLDNYAFASHSVPLAAFAHVPTDARSACIAVVDSIDDSATAVGKCRELGAPVVLVCKAAGLEWWRQTPTGSVLHAPRPIPPDAIGRFFKEHKQDFSPRRIYRAKTLGRFESSQQLAFVDAGLLPLVESEIGERLSSLVARVVNDVVEVLEPHPLSSANAQKVFRGVFWLLAAKMLQDKRVPRFIRLPLGDLGQVFERVAGHYAKADNMPPRGGRWRSAFGKAAESISGFPSLANVSTEALAYLYETTLVDKAVRKQLGTHSTPSYLVDYMVWQLAPWISDIPQEERRVFEPACGHAAFLVSMMRLLRMEFDGDDAAWPRYARTHLRGVEKDAFAREIALLSLTLADIPNRNGWKITERDMFASDILARESRRARILLANPPYEKFGGEDRAEYGSSTRELKRTKAVEMLARTLPHLPEGGVFGVVVPQGVLHSKEAADVRELLTTKFELSEICLFPDKVFTFSGMETAILLGRRRGARLRAEAPMHYRRVRESGISRFRESYAVDSESRVPQARFGDDDKFDMRVPELGEVWDYLGCSLRLSSLAQVGKGFDFQGEESLPANAERWANRRKRGYVPAYLNVPTSMAIYGRPLKAWANPKFVETPRSGMKTSVAQVLLNYARVSRGPWRLKGVMDCEGHAVTSRFITIRPIDPSVSLDYLWALLNSPVANAYAYSHLGKRDNLVGTMRRMPVRTCSARESERVVDAAQAYLAATRQSETFTLQSEPDRKRVRELLLRMDAEVLRLYDLPPRLERKLLNSFNDKDRKGVGCVFGDYFPRDFTPCIPLHEYISDEYRRSTVGEIRERYSPVQDPAAIAALDKAYELVTEDE